MVAIFFEFRKSWYSTIKKRRSDLKIRPGCPPQVGLKFEFRELSFFGRLDAALGPLRPFEFNSVSINNDRDLYEVPFTEGKSAVFRTQKPGRCKSSLELFSKLPICRSQTRRLVQGPYSREEIYCEPKAVGTKLFFRIFSEFFPNYLLPKDWTPRARRKSKGQK